MRMGGGATRVGSGLEAEGVTVEATGLAASARGKPMQASTMAGVDAEVGTDDSVVTGGVGAGGATTEAEVDTGAEATTSVAADAAGGARMAVVVTGGETSRVRCAVGATRTMGEAGSLTSAA